jgi:hypothetical protein
MTEVTTTGYFPCTQMKVSRLITVEHAESAKFSWDKKSSGRKIDRSF